MYLRRYGGAGHQDEAATRLKYRHASVHLPANRGLGMLQRQALRLPSAGRAGWQPLQPEW